MKGLPLPPSAPPLRPRGADTSIVRDGQCAEDGEAVGCIQKGRLRATAKAALVAVLVRQRIWGAGGAL